MIFSHALSFCKKSYLPSWATKTLESLSLREKIGQLCMVMIAPNQTVLSSRNPYNSRPEFIASLISSYNIGGLIFGPGNSLQQQQLIQSYQRMSSIPLLIGQDAERGVGMRLADIHMFPFNMTLGNLQDNTWLYKTGLAIGKQCKQVGVHINFAPVVDCNTNPLNPVIGNRSFGADPKKVTQKAKSIVKGMQEAGVLTCAKHFPGHGDTYQDSHLVLPVVSRSLDDLYACELYPFQHLISAGIDAIMIGHLAVPALDPQFPASLSRKIVTDFLRKQLNFSGLIITDGLGMQAIQSGYTIEESVLLAIKAGNDILLCPPFLTLSDAEKVFVYIETAVWNGHISIEEIDAHVFKILSIKEQLGLHTNRCNKQIYSCQEINSFEIQELQRQLIQEAIDSKSTASIE